MSIRRKLRFFVRDQESIKLTERSTILAAVDIILNFKEQKINQIIDKKRWLSLRHIYFFLHESNSSAIRPCHRILQNARKVIDELLIHTSNKHVATKDHCGHYVYLYDRN